MSGTHPITLISDANVLIDYAKSDVEVLSLIGRSLGAIHVAREVLREVREINLTEARRLGLRICVPTVEEYREAAGRGGPLSSRDKLCLSIARKRGWACLTNDQCLRGRCKASGVKPVWGLEAMVLACRLGGIGSERAIATARTIHRNNPHHITAEIVAKFIQQIRAIDP